MVRKNEIFFWNEFKKIRNDIENFKFGVLNFSLSNFYIDDSKFEIIIVVGVYFQKENSKINSPYPFGFYRKSTKNSIFFIIPSELQNLPNYSKKYIKKTSNAFDIYKNQKPFKNKTKNKNYNKLVLQPSENQVVQTSSKFYNKLNKRFNFTYDPCPLNPIVDAMVSKWGNINYINPPFSYVAGFFYKAIEFAKNEKKTSIILAPVCFNRNWFIDVVKSNTLKEIIFLRYGVKFEGFKRPTPGFLALFIIGFKENSDDTLVSFGDGFNENRRHKTIYSKCI